MHGAIRDWPSPNFGPRRDGKRPEMVVLHYTEMRSAEAALERLSDPAAEVSAHYLIARDGTVWRLVDEVQRAWHAGEGAWQGRGDVNSRSIGIELDNDGASPFCAPLMTALEGLLADIMARHALRPNAVIAHSDIAPERKIDPGARFDWRRLARSGLAVWPEHPGASWRALGGLLDTIGYPDAPAKARLRAFRLRFRPGASGPEDDTDRSLADAVANLYQAFKA